MTNLVHLHCDGLSFDTEGRKLSCTHELQATSHYTNATELRKAARERGWKTARQRFVQKTVYPSGSEHEHTWSVAIDLCPAHAGQSKAFSRSKPSTVPDRDYRKAQ